MQLGYKDNIEYQAKRNSSSHFTELKEESFSCRSSSSCVIGHWRGASAWRLEPGFSETV
jgi:hypothetical protein